MSYQSSLKTWGLRLAALAAILGVLASAVILLTPMRIHSITTTAAAGQGETSVESITRQSWYQVQGWWGVAVVLIFGGLYAGGYALARRSAAIPLALLSVLLLAVTYLAGFSIGLFYLPAAMTLAAGSICLLISSRMTLKD